MTFSFGFDSQSVFINRYLIFIREPKSREDLVNFWLFLFLNFLICKNNWKMNNHTTVFISDENVLLIPIFWMIITLTLNLTKINWFCWCKYNIVSKYIFWIILGLDNCIFYWQTNIFLNCYSKMRKRICSINFSARFSNRNIISICLFWNKFICSWIFNWKFPTLIEICLPPRCFIGWNLDWW